MTVFLVAEAGVPLTSRSSCASSAPGVDVHSYALSIIAMLTAVIAALPCGS